MLHVSHDPLKRCRAIAHFRLTLTPTWNFYVSYVQHSNCSYFTFYTYVYYIAQLITILLSGAGDGDDNKGKYRSFVGL